MVRIRRAQMQQMLDADRSLLRRVVDKRVREQYADVIRGLPADLVDEMIENGIRAARGYGLTQAEDVAGFVLVIWSREWRSCASASPIISCAGARSSLTH